MYLTPLSLKPAIFQTDSNRSSDGERVDNGLLQQYLRLNNNEDIDLVQVPDKSSTGVKSVTLPPGFTKQIQVSQEFRAIEIMYFGLIET